MLLPNPAICGTFQRIEQPYSHRRKHPGHLPAGRQVRVFTRMRALLLTHKDIMLQLEKIEKKFGSHDEQIALVFSYLKKLLNPPQPVRTRIGFRRKDEKD